MSFETFKSFFIILIVDCSPAARPWGLRDLVIGAGILDGEGVGFFMSLLGKDGLNSAIGLLSIFSNVIFFRIISSPNFFSPSNNLSCSSFRCFNNFPCSSDNLLLSVFSVFSIYFIMSSISVSFFGFL